MRKGASKESDWRCAPLAFLGVLEAPFTVPRYGYSCGEEPKSVHEEGRAGGLRDVNNGEVGADRERSRRLLRGSWQRSLHKNCVVLGTQSPGNEAALANGDDSTVPSTDHAVASQ